MFYNPNKTDTAYDVVNNTPTEPQSQDNKRTIHHCCKQGKDVNKTLEVVHYADTELEAIRWLEQNGGGVYRNNLHRFQIEVKLPQSQDELLHNGVTYDACKKINGLWQCHYCAFKTVGCSDVPVSCNNYGRDDNRNIYWVER